MAKHTLKVIEAPFGWTVCMGIGMTSPFRTRARAILEAKRICDQLRVHGEIAELIIEEFDRTAQPDAGGPAS